MKNLLQAILPPGKTDPADLPAIPARFRPKRVLFLDDDEIIRRMVQLFATSFNMELTVVSTVAEAASLVSAEGPAPFDIVLLDVRLANGSGLTVYREVFRKWPAVQVVFLTGNADEFTSKEVEAIGPARIYNKATALSFEFLSSLLEQMGVSRCGSTPPIPPVK